jgi:hypothetical protein
MSALVAALVRACAPAGLNLVGVADPARYDAVVAPARQSAALLAGTRAIVVVANGGPALWRAFSLALAADPRQLTEEPHPLDAFVQRAVAEADVALGAIHRRWFFAAANADLHLDFRVLGHLAGLGGRSRLGLLLHPRHGPWMALRAACFLDVALPFAVPDGADPCAGCPGYCASTCPGAAFPTGAWDVERCSAFHREDSRCAATCHARLSCPRGEARSRYSPDEITYHYNRELGRRELRGRIGVANEADRFAGEGPHWGVWRGRINVKG